MKNIWYDSGTWKYISQKAKNDVDKLSLSSKISVFSKRTKSVIPEEVHSRKSKMTINEPKEIYFPDEK